MREETILVPSRLGFTETLEFARLIQKQPHELKIIFDFSGMGHIEPFAFVMISAVVNNLVRAMPRGSVYARNHQSHTYPAHMGFFKAFGLDFGNAPGEAGGGLRYLPITIIDVMSMQREAVLGGEAIGKVVDGHALRLAKVLAHEEQGDLVETFRYSLCEIIRNVAEHSKSANVVFCAQYWPTKDRAEIAILDHGVGIYETLRCNPHLSIENQQHAVNLSLLPGVSGKSYRGAKQRPNMSQDKRYWQNSGYGLYMTGRMCRSDGSFFIGSHDSAVFLRGDEKHYPKFEFPGTVVRMVFRPSAIGKLKDALQSFDAEGREIARTIQGTVIGASAASRMLTSDFTEL